MQGIWQRYKAPPSWAWVLAFGVSIASLFILGLRQEYLFRYWAYVAFYNSLLIVLGVFYLRRFYKVIQSQRKEHTVGARFTLNLIRVVPILTLLPIISFYAFSFSTVQENTKLAEAGFNTLNERLLSEIDGIQQNLILYRAEGYFNLSTNIIGIIQDAMDNPNYAQNLTQILNTLVENQRICRGVIIRGDEQIQSVAGDLCANVDFLSDMQSEYNVVDKDQNILFSKLVLTSNVSPNESTTVLFYFIKNSGLTSIFDRMTAFKSAVNSAKINISNTILTQQFIVDFVTTVALTIIAMMILVSKMLSNLMVPLNNITIASRKISEGEYGIQAPKSIYDDDMNILLTEFNKMSTQVKEARTGLDTQNIYLETIIRYSDAIIAFDPKFRISLINAPLSELFAVEDNAIIGKSYEVLHIDFLTESIALFDHKEQFSVDMTYQRLNLNITGARLTATGKTLGYILIIKDITEITKNQKLLAWKEVARRMAHEVKNPLNPILLSAERLRNKLLPEVSAKQQHIVDKTTQTIIDQVSSIDNIINSFSVLGKPSYQLQLHSLEKVIAGVRELYATTNITLHFGSVPEVLLDKDAINRMLINLIKNSIEAAHKDTPIQISIETKTIKERVWLTIIDNGVGFDPLVVDSIFEPYITTKDSGTGLGMAIVEKIIAAHNATMTIDASYTSGAKIDISFPLPE